MNLLTGFIYNMVFFKIYVSWQCYFNLCINARYFWSRANSRSDQCYKIWILLSRFNHGFMLGISILFNINQDIYFVPLTFRIETLGCFILFAFCQFWASLILRNVTVQAVKQLYKMLIHLKPFAPEQTKHRLYNFGMILLTILF